MRKRVGTKGCYVVDALRVPFGEEIEFHRQRDTPGFRKKQHTVPLKSIRVTEEDQAK